MYSDEVNPIVMEALKQEVQQIVTRHLFIYVDVFDILEMLERYLNYFNQNRKVYNVNFN